ncbi:MAG: septum formation protein Maf [Chthonomonas sp.]|nr:septum formation protein Maf [Chthonomonas sp.]
MRLKPHPYPVILASASPRRKELLNHLVDQFTVVCADVDEDSLTVSDPWQTAQRLAREKALTVFDRHPESLVIAGDTVVAMPDGDAWIQLAKPTSLGHAKEMLRALNGRTHLVITGVALRWPTGMAAFTDETKVTFRAIQDSEIEDYVQTGEPMDKAGAYAIQGGAKQFVAKIEGSINNVIGLPTERLEEALRDVR